MEFLKGKTFNRVKIDPSEIKTESAFHGAGELRMMG
jgi:hypothetical protein